MKKNPARTFSTGGQFKKRNESKLALLSASVYICGLKQYLVCSIISQMSRKPT